MGADTGKLIHKSVFILDPGDYQDSHCRYHRQLLFRIGFHWLISPTWHQGNIIHDQAVSCFNCTHHRNKRLSILWSTSMHILTLRLHPWDFFQRPLLRNRCIFFDHNEKVCHRDVFVLWKRKRKRLLVYGRLTCCLHDRQPPLASVLVGETTITTTSESIVEMSKSVWCVGLWESTSGLQRGLLPAFCPGDWSKYCHCQNIVFSLLLFWLSERNVPLRKKLGQTETEEGLKSNKSSKMLCPIIKNI